MVRAIPVDQHHGKPSLFSRCSRKKLIWLYVISATVTVILSSVYIATMQQALVSLQDKQQRTDDALWKYIEDRKQSMRQSGPAPDVPVPPPRVRSGQYLEEPKQSMRESRPAPNVSMLTPSVGSGQYIEESKQSMRESGPASDVPRPLPHDRRLRSLGNIAAYNLATLVTGCVTVALNSADVSLDLATKACGPSGSEVRCPPCFLVTNGHATNKLTLSNIATAKISGSVSLGSSSTPFETALARFTFVNADSSNYAIVSDGSVESIVGASSYSMAFGYTGGSGALYFPSIYFNSGLHTGSGYSGTGATLTAAGALSLDGAATFNAGTVFSGGVDVTSSGTTNIDLSGSAGTFLTPTGAVTIGNGNVGISGASTFSADVATTGTAAVDLSGSTGLCTAQNAWIVR
eukprot:TRINITY_DN7952_c0_g1_i3.p1 TRINITY_DN7952_c0_g1~~TRINITY_DN7952_c0_g1_i3.p1  ORF type:complete len:404 (-),score=30.28 TRINITY_DN7952_c0_g1_i3:97-1308(-)